MERDRNLFWKLLEPEHPKAEAFSRKLMGNREDGDDLYQDALVLALTKFSSLKETAAFRPWLYRIIVNCFKHRFRTPWYRRVIPLSEEISATLKTPDPNHGFVVGRLLTKALGAISAEERTLITLFELEGWSIAELSRLYQKPDGTIKARLSRSRKKMKTALAKHESKNLSPIKLKQSTRSDSAVTKLADKRYISHSPSERPAVMSKVSQMFQE